MNNQMLAYLSENSLLYKHQSGFLPNHSTVTQLGYLAHEWQMALEKGEQVHTVFLDLSKAYDRVSIPGLSLPWRELCQESLCGHDFLYRHSQSCIRQTKISPGINKRSSDIRRGWKSDKTLQLTFVTHRVVLTEDPLNFWLPKHKLFAKEPEKNDTPCQEPFPALQLLSAIFVVDFLLLFCST